MEYCFLKGFLLVLLIQNCTSEGPSSSIQSSTGVTLQGDQTLPGEAELPPAEVLPVVAPPSLKEVQQAVQEASEQVEGRGAEEVLKELLERVVGAALGQVEGGSEAKADEGAVQEMVEEDALGAEGRRAEGNTEVKVSEQEVVEGEDMGIKGGDTGVEEEQGLSEVDALEDGAEEGEAFAEGEGETAAGSVVETTGGVKIGGREAYGVEVISESLDIQVSQEVAGGTVTVSEETGGDPPVERPGMWDNNEQVVLSEEKGAAETEAQEAEETPAVVEVAVGREPELEKVEESDHGVAAADWEQMTDVWGKENVGEAEIQVDKLEGEATALPSDHYETETKQPVAAEAREEEEEEVNRVKDAEGAKVEDQQGHLAVEGGAGGNTETEVTNGSERDGEGKMKGELVASVNEEGEQQAGEEEQIALETSFGSETEDQETLLISAPVPEDGAEASLQPSPGNQTPTLSPLLGGVEKGENTLGDEISIHGNEIITPTDDLLPQSPDMAKPTLDNVLKDALAEPPQAEREEPGVANGLAEDTETNELGLEAWKIGAISAAIFLALETALILIYILKCHNKNSALALQRACEEGSVEAEATTGGDCSDDTLPASNGDAQQIAEFDPSDVASTLAINKEQHKVAHAIPMSDLPSGPTEESANTGPGPDSSQDLRTSIL